MAAGAYLQKLLSRILKESLYRKYSEKVVSGSFVFLRRKKMVTRERQDQSATASGKKPLVQLT